MDKAKEYVEGRKKYCDAGKHVPDWNTITRARGVNGEGNATWNAVCVKCGVDFTIEVMRRT